MDIILYGLAAVIGFIGGAIYFSKPMPFEDMIFAALRQGKRVIISMDNQALIFVYVDGKLKITQGTADFYDEPYVEAYDSDADNVVHLYPGQSSNNISSDLKDPE